MVDELRQAVAQVEQESEEVQRRIAHIIQEELDEREWDALVATPESRTFLTELAAETRASIAKGETEEGGWDL